VVLAGRATDVSNSIAKIRPTQPLDAVCWPGARRWVEPRFVAWHWHHGSFPSISRSRPEASLMNMKNNESAAIEELVQALAQAFDDRDEAGLILRRAGFPSERVPMSRTEVPLVFWNLVVTAICKGAIEGGVRVLADAAAAYYPGNKVFARYRSPP
jgi:hypothetical protein